MSSRKLLEEIELEDFSDVFIADDWDENYIIIDTPKAPLKLTVESSEGEYPLQTTLSDFPF